MVHLHALSERRYLQIRKSEGAGGAVPAADRVGSWRNSLNSHLLGREGAEVCVWIVEGEGSPRASPELTVNWEEWLTHETESDKEKVSICQRPMLEEKLSFSSCKTSKDSDSTTSTEIGSHMNS